MVNKPSKKAAKQKQRTFVRYKSITGYLAGLRCNLAGTEPSKRAHCTTCKGNPESQSKAAFRKTVGGVKNELGVRALDGLEKVVNLLKFLQGLFKEYHGALWKLVTRPTQLKQRLDEEITIWELV